VNESRLLFHDFLSETDLPNTHFRALRGRGDRLRARGAQRERRLGARLAHNVVQVLVHEAALAVEADRDVGRRATQLRNLQKGKQERKAASASALGSAHRSRWG
jgi:hypothetical protein